MRLTPAERDRLLLFTAAQLARTRRERTGASRLDGARLSSPPAESVARSRLYFL